MRYVVDMPKHSASKKSVYIVDESDERIFRDYERFYKSIKHEKVRTICLTATAYDGDENSLELACLKALDFKIYRNSDSKEDFVPKITKSIDLS